MSIDEKVKRRDAELLHDAVRDPVDEQLYRDALRVLFDVALVLLGLLIGFHFGLSRSQAATRHGTPPRCEYVGPLPGTPTNAEEPPQTVTAGSLPDAPMVERVGEPHESWEYLGRWKTTGFCPCRICNGRNAGHTASGAPMTPGRTVAVGGIPFGTVLKVGGTEYVVEDRGTPYGHIDILYADHGTASNHGVQYMEVYRKTE